MSWHWVQHTPSSAYTECSIHREYSIHQVQHTPSTAYTEYSIHRVHYPPKIVCVPFILIEYELTSGCSFSFRRASLHDRPSSASSPWELKRIVTLLLSHGCKLTNCWLGSQHPARHPLTASTYSSNLAWSRPPSVPLNSHDHGLQVRMIIASKCISKLTQLQPPNSLDRGLQVHLQTCSIPASKLLDHGIQTAWLWPPSFHDHGLQVQLEIARPRSRSVSQSSLDGHI